VRIMLIPLLALVGLTGCAREGGLVRVDDQRQNVNRWTIQTMDDESVANAVITQHTLYPYHFAANSAVLNELGERDVKILAQHYSRYPGEINLRRGREDQGMYDARVQNVTRALVAMGVDQGSLRIVDKVPGGDGVSSERALEVLSRSMMANQSSESGSSTSQGDSADRTDRGNRNTNDKGTQR